MTTKMGSTRLVLGLICAIAVAAPATAAAKSVANSTFGLGLILGGPTGLSAELRLSDATALDFAVGFAAFEDDYDDNGYFHLDYLVMPIDLGGRDIDIPLYLGIGGYYFEHNRFGDHHDGHLGLRVPAGLAIEFRRVPFQIFVELGFRFDIATIDHDDDGGRHIDGAAGFRLFF